MWLSETKGRGRGEELQEGGQHLECKYNNLRKDFENSFKKKKMFLIEGSEDFLRATYSPSFTGTLRSGNEVTGAHQLSV